MLENKSSYEYCVITDSKDVVFQSDPLPVPSKVVLVDEGMMHSQSGWNMIDQFEAQANVREFRTDYSKQPVLNGGVVLGTTEGVKNYLFLLWSNTLRAIGRCTDQGVLNYLYADLQHDSDYLVVDPNSSSVCLTGEAVKEGFVTPIFKNGIFFHKSGEAYAIVHQWERTIHKAEVLAHYLG